MKFIDIINEADVDSTWLNSLDYNEPTGDIIMNTAYGLKYRIKKVPAYVFNLWIKAKSKGIFFHRFIKNHYNIVRA